MNQVFVLIGFFLISMVFAEKAGVRIDDLGAQGDTSIVIKKGAAGSCVEYELVTGQEEVAGDPEYDRSKAYASWKNACAEWKKSMKEMNKGNQMITLNCNTPSAVKDGQTQIFKSNGSYRMKTRIKE